MSTGTNSAPKSLELGAFLPPRLGVLVGLEAMEGARGQREPQITTPHPHQRPKTIPERACVGNGKVGPELVHFEQKTRAQRDTSWRPASHPPHLRSEVRRGAGASPLLVGPATVEAAPPGRCAVFLCKF